MKRTTLVLSLLLIVSLSFAQTPVHRDPQEGINPKTVTAYQIEPITVDGDLSDWPTDLEKRSCGEFYPSYTINSRALSTQDNWFMVAWNDQTNQVFIAGYSEDDVNVSQLSKWNGGVIGSDGWFCERWEVYTEWDNDDGGAYGPAEGGNLEYVIVQNDKGRTDGNYATSQEKDAAGNILDEGTAFWIYKYTMVTPDARPPFAQAKWVITPKDPNHPFGPYVGRFEMSFKVLNFLMEDVIPDENTDTVDLDPNVNNGRGIGFDMTFMDRDGDISSMVSTRDTWAWIGWSSESKVNQPQFNGKLLFSTEFKELTHITNWEVF
ncbi:MAG: hypothetical protein C4527_07380 [Candidatus Omnitrophota bacterium]|jgi:hypothetical protein|nr:MAG: hypothetical protein C4527_07380 [Candidatus Omnitrophota bacterium]